MLTPCPPQMDPTTLRQVFSCFPTGVTAVCALEAATPIGMAASSFTSVSLQPALVSVCMQNTSTTWPRLRDLPAVGLSVLAAHQEPQCRSLSSKTGDRFETVKWEATPSGAVFVQDATAWLECTVVDSLPAGDHTVTIFAVAGVWADPEAPPLVFHGSRFRMLAEAHEGA
jgi:flavin reductase (DIM6/NTAB) family NADH-FMN oxidoreductase RutF